MAPKPREGAEVAVPFWEVGTGPKLQGGSRGSTQGLV